MGDSELYFTHSLPHQSLLLKKAKYHVGAEERAQQFKFMKTEECFSVNFVIKVSTFVDVERSFSQYKYLLNYRRESLTSSTLTPKDSSR